MPTTPVNTFSTVEGAIQRWLEKRWMNMPRRMFDTPLVNSSLGNVATIPKHGGQMVEMRKFDEFPVSTGTSDDSPVMYAATAEPSECLEVTAEKWQIPFAELVDCVAMNHLLEETDPIDILNEVFRMLRTKIKRDVHRVVNDSFVRQIADTNSVLTSASLLPGAFKTVYAGDKDGFSELQEGDLHTMATMRRARSLLQNSGAHPVYGRLFACICSDGIIEQLKDDDKNFADIVKRHEDKMQKTFVEGGMIDYQGLRFIPQDDEYRALLPADGGLQTTRKDSGRVQFAHVLGKGSFSYVDLAGKRRVNPKFKVQDITQTGNLKTIGYRIPFRAAVVDNTYGVNVAGTTEYYESMTDIA